MISTYILKSNSYENLNNIESKATQNVSDNTQNFLQFNSKRFEGNLSFNMHNLISKIYLCICRLPIIDKFLRIPTSLLYHSNFEIDYLDLVKSDVTLPSIDYLRDHQILKEYLNHILFVGWTNRMHFEYEYVNLLTLLNNFIRTENYGLDANKTELPYEDLIEHNKCTSVVIKSLSTWLIKSTLTPESGNSLNSLYELISRNKLPIFFGRSYGRQYMDLNNLLKKFTRYNKYIDATSIQLLNINLDPTESDYILESLNERVLYLKNLERTLSNDLALNSNTNFFLGQISLEGLLKFSGIWNNMRLSNDLDERLKLINASTETNEIISEGIEDLSKDIDTEQMKDTNEVLTGQTNTAFDLESSSVKRTFNNSNLDLTSVLRSVLDYYEIFFNSSTLQIKYDILKSTSYLANTLFDSKQHYDTLMFKLKNQLNSLLSTSNENITQNQFSITPIVNELIDESTLSLFLYTNCLCKCCLQQSQSVKNKDFENMNKLIEMGLKSPSLTVKVCTVHGLFYWLESISLGCVNNNEAKQFVDHLCKQIYSMKDFTAYAISNPRFISVLWSSIFFTIENCLDSVKETQNFVSIFIKLTLDILCDPNTPYFLFYQIYLGLERLLLSNMAPSIELNQMQKFFTTKFYDDQRTLCINSLRLTFLYVSSQTIYENYWKYKNDIDISMIESGNDCFSVIWDQQSEYSQILELNNQPDLQAALLKVLELANSFFDKIKTSSTIKESCVYARMLPYILCDFLPPHDLLNKLVTEFLNSLQYPYPQHLAYIIYCSFDILQKRGLQSQIQEWCLLCLSNFVQIPNIYESIWLITCLLISVSKNTWLKSLFQFVINRYGAFEDIDKTIFFYSVISFQNELKDKTQISAVYKTFDSVAKYGTPYIELIKILDTRKNKDN